MSLNQKILKFFPFILLLGVFCASFVLLSPSLDASPGASTNYEITVEVFAGGGTAEAASANYSTSLEVVGQPTPIETIGETPADKYFYKAAVGSEHNKVYTGYGYALDEPIPLTVRDVRVGGLLPDGMLLSGGSTWEITWVATDEVSEIASFEARFATLEGSYDTGDFVTDFPYVCYDFFGNPSTGNLSSTDRSFIWKVPNISAESIRVAVGAYEYGSYHDPSWNYYSYISYVSSEGYLQTQGGWEDQYSFAALGEQSHLQMVEDGDDGVILVWQDERGGNFDIYAQKIDKNGAYAWGDILGEGRPGLAGIPVCEASGDQIYPRVTTDGAGGAIITWTDSRPTANARDIYAKRITAAGNTAAGWGGTGDNGIIVSNAANDQGYSADEPVTDPAPDSDYAYSGPKIVGDGAGGAFIVWMDSVDGTDQDLFVQRIKSNGTISWEANGKRVTGDGNDNLKLFPQIAADGQDGVVITWQEKDTHMKINAQRFDGAGVWKWGAYEAGLIVFQGGEVGGDKDIKIPQIAIDGSSVLFTFRPSSAPYVPHGLWVAEVSLAEPGTVNTRVQLSTDDNVTQAYPQIVRSESGVWGDSGVWVLYQMDSEGNQKVYMRKFSDPYGPTDIGSEVKLSSNSEDLWAERQAYLTTDGAGGAIAVWEAAWAAKYGIYAARVKYVATPTPHWELDDWDPGSPTEKTIAIHGSLDRAHPRIASDGRGGAYIAWLSYASPTDINMIRVLGDGEPPGDEGDPVVQNPSPTAGANINAAEVTEITWGAYDPEGNLGTNPINIYYSIDGGNTWAPALETGGLNDGSYDWSVPEIATTEAYIKITAEDISGNIGETTSGPFTISGGVAPTITLYTPNGGEMWNAGAHEITWEASDPAPSSGLDVVLIWYSTDEGTDGFSNLITDSATPAAGSYTWNVSGVESEQMRIRAVVRDNVGLLATDESDANFIIDSTPPTVTIVAPTTGTAWAGGSDQVISWTATDEGSGLRDAPGPITVKYGPTPPSWTVTIDELTNNVAPNSGIHTWEASSDNSQVAKIQITAIDNAGNIGIATSDAFTVDSVLPTVNVDVYPGNTEGQAFKGGDSIDIVWPGTISDNMPDPDGLLLPDYIWLYYSTGEGYPYEVIASREVDSPLGYSWDLPLIDSTGVRVRVGAEDKAGNIGTDESTYAFAIDSTSPEAPTGFSADVVPAGEQLELKWTYSNSSDADRVKIYYRTDSVYPTAPDGGDLLAAPITTSEGVVNANPRYGDFSTSGSFLLQYESTSGQRLINGQTYYFSVFAFDKAGHYSLRTTASGTPADNQGPQVVLKRPEGSLDEEGQGWVRDVKIQVEFDEPMDQAETELAFSMGSEEGEVAGGTFSWDGNTLFYTPPATLEGIETYYVTVEGVTAGARDLAGNFLQTTEEWNFTTSNNIDGEPPSAITDLVAMTGVNPGWIDLTWTAPYDNNAVKLYYARYSTWEAIDTLNEWATAEVYDQSWVPKVSGEVESYTLTGFEPGTIYYFSVRSEDYTPHKSGLSNPASAEAGTLGAIFPPTDAKCSIIDSEGEKVYITWTHSSSEAISGYHIYRGTTPFFTAEAASLADEVGFDDDDVLGTFGIPDWIDPNSGDAIKNGAQSVAINYFYVVRAFRSGGYESPNSNRVGEYTYELPKQAPTNYVWVAYVLDTAHSVDSRPLLENLYAAGAAGYNQIPNCDAGYPQYFDIGTQQPLGGTHTLTPGEALQVKVTNSGVFQLTGGVSLATFNLTTKPPTNYNWVSLPLDDSREPTLNTLYTEMGGATYIDSGYPQYFNVNAQQPLGGDYNVKVGTALQVKLKANTSWPSR